ncbi:MAG: hypothetical protein HC937_03375 [Aquincola sp.]|nr:hypothetical protein [Aquincola sp.]
MEADTTMDCPLDPTYVNSDGEQALSPPAADESRVLSLLWARARDEHGLKA